MNQFDSICEVQSDKVGLFNMDIVLLGFAIKMSQITN